MYCTFPFFNAVVVSDFAVKLFFTVESFSETACMCICAYACWKSTFFNASPPHPNTSQTLLLTAVGKRLRPPSAFYRKYFYPFLFRVERRGQRELLRIRSRFSRLIVFAKYKHFENAEIDRNCRFRGHLPFDINVNPYEIPKPFSTFDPTKWTKWSDLTQAYWHKGVWNNNTFIRFGSSFSVNHPRINKPNFFCTTIAILGNACTTANLSLVSFDFFR